MKQVVVYALALVIVVSGVGVSSFNSASGSTSSGSSVCGSSATSLFESGGVLGELLVSADLNPLPGTKACIDSLFLNSSRSPMNLYALSETMNVTDSSGALVYGTSCDVFSQPAMLVPGHTWECTEYWNAGSGPYELRVAVYSKNFNIPIQVEAAVEAPVFGSQVCVSNIGDLELDIPQDVPTLNKIITSPSFIQYSNDRCWTWDSTQGEVGSPFDVFVFFHVSSAIWSPCGFPSFTTDLMVYVWQTYSHAHFTGFSIEPMYPPYGYACPSLPDDA